MNKVSVHLNGKEVEGFARNVNSVSLVASAVSHAIWMNQQEAAIDRRMISQYTKNAKELTPEEKEGLAGN